jgi:hypothetical protein
MKSKRTEITVETDRMLIITTPRKIVNWCRACEALAEMVPVEWINVHVNGTVKAFVTMAAPKF